MTFNSSHGPPRDDEPEPTWPNPRRLPVVRGDCEGAGVCVKFSCRYNLTVDVSEKTGWIGLNAPPVQGGRHALNDRKRDLEAFAEAAAERVCSVETNCALDYVDRHGGQSVRDVAKALGTSYQRVQQIEDGAMRKLRNGKAGRALLVHLGVRKEEDL